MMITTNTRVILHLRSHSIYTSSSTIVVIESRITGPITFTHGSNRVVRQRGAWQTNRITKGRAKHQVRAWLWTYGHRPGNAGRRIAVCFERTRGT